MDYNFSVRVILCYNFTFYMTINIVELPNKVTSFIQSSLHHSLSSLPPVAAVLSVWRPSPEVQDMMTEGRRFKIYHLVASEAR